MKRNEFSKMPSQWIHEGGLIPFSWGNAMGSDNLAALMVYLALVHRADGDTGEISMTYNALEAACSISKTKVSAGLNILYGRGLIDKDLEKQSKYWLPQFNPSEGWAKLPESRLYRGDHIQVFMEFHLRKRAELDALKLYLLFAAKRDRKTNLAHITYPQITVATGIGSNSIKAALTVLSIHRLVYQEWTPSNLDPNRMAACYRLADMGSYQHQGTRNRASR